MDKYRDEEDVSVFPDSGLLICLSLVWVSGSHVSLLFPVSSSQLLSQHP